MKKPTINITKEFINGLWKLTEIKSPIELNIQKLRLFVYCFSLSNETTIKTSLSSYKVWKDTYSYFDEKGKRKHLMNYKTFINFITLQTPFWNYDPLIKLIHFNFDDMLFYINWENKDKWQKQHKGDEYIDSPAIQIKCEEWELIKYVCMNELKLYFYILYNKLRGPYNFITISLNDLKDKLLINNKSNKQLKRILSKYLNDIKSKGIIYEYTFHKYNLKIQKHK
jgi:hypothetical protein